ncbi:protein-S-isoprenylcysteine O-methyltransferase Ste14 [Rhizobium sp. BK650]|uniref:methyltransferase family protein n=1 Tax=Rhizobium sp. BK650 TaxID=2586990 RepID=UPI00160E543D|nr:isoprenylcysteine carboxylmethyltransferase family protein [Rhizobium sp. BK650]MBB3659819.1 protein-S-isoprenylcysteine O-methyltransferase Ste14 [Rhizobium sp. BK650]
MKDIMLRSGTFLFKYRNQVFPLIIIALFIAVPPSTAPWGNPALEQAKDALALLIVVSGLILRATVIGYAYIRRGGLNKRVYADELVTEGMFGVCRNPLYVGNMLIYAGLFVFHGNPAVIAVGCTLFAFFYQCIVYAEEAFLHDKFGAPYEAYCRDVPRWTLKRSAFYESTTGMAFNLKRVVAKDYSTMSSTFIALLATEFYRVSIGSITEEEQTRAIALVLLLAAVLALTGLVSAFKKRGVFEEIPSESIQ